MVIDEVIAVGEHIVLKAINCETQQKEKQTASGILIAAEEQKSGTKVNKVNGGKERVKLVVHSIGPAVDKEKYNINIGDEVVCNDLDLQTIGDDNDNLYALTRAVSVRAVVKSKDY